MTALAAAEPRRSAARDLLTDAAITVFPSFAAAADAWHKAATSCIHYGFQTFEWLDTWQATIGAAEGVMPLIVYVAGRDGAPLLLLPLGIRRDKLCRVLCFLGDDPTDYHAPLIAPDLAEIAPAEIAALWSRILSALPPIDAICFDKMPAEIEGVPNPMVILAGAAPSEVAISTALPASFAEFAKSRSASFFAQNRRKRRQLGALGALAFEVPRDEVARREILTAALRQKTRRAIESGARNRLARAGYREFYERAARRRFAAGGGVHVSCLRVDETIVAAHIGLVHGGRYYILMPTFEDGVSAKYSAGRLLIESLIDWAITQHFAIFDFTIGDESYKRSWADREMQLYAMRVARSRKGALLLASQDCWWKLRQNPRLRALLLPLRDAVRRRRRVDPSD